ncbi:MAG: glycerol-3-phosphate dehydrogenase/oxidase [Ktedonobacterales bacterium]
MASTPLDVLVIGGGITGAGIALDAVARGYRTGLIERSDFASGTSSRSTKLVHGGIRYLPQFDVPLVREALIERGRLLRNAPHLVQPLSFILPLYASSRRPVGLPIAPPLGIGLGLILDTGLTVYDGLAGQENIAPHHRLTSDDVVSRAPCLKVEGLKTGFVYFDAQTDDTRLTIAVLLSAAQRGALLANYCAATGFTEESGTLRGVVAETTRPNLSPSRVAITARHIVNATGVWAEETERLAGESPGLEVVPSKGSHLVFAKESFDLGDEAIVLPETEDRRIIFIVPWLGTALVGTTDEAARDLETPVANESEIDYILGHLNRFVRVPVSRSDILATYSGYRPLLKLRTGRTPARLSRSHAVVEGDDGLISISGGKLTTYRRMAQDVMDRIDAREGRHQGHPTTKMPLFGGAGWFDSRAAFLRRAGQLGLGREIAEHLSQAYGTAASDLLDLIAASTELKELLVPDLPYIAAEVVHACRAELALTIEDVLARRTHIAIQERSRGTIVAPRVAELMAHELGWPVDEQDRQLAAYQDFARKESGPLGLPTHHSKARVR